MPEEMGDGGGPGPELIGHMHLEAYIIASPCPDWMSSIYPCLVPDCNVEYSYNISHIHQIATKGQTNGEKRHDFFRAEKKFI